MPHIYDFTVTGRRSEALGRVALPDDLEAVAFADRLIGEMTPLEADRYVGCSLDISEEHRTVAVLSLSP